jgi:hypothetical protein
MTGEAKSLSVKTLAPDDIFGSRVQTCSRRPIDAAWLGAQVGIVSSGKLIWRIVAAKSGVHS